MAEKPRQLTIGETFGVLHEKNLLIPAHFIYDVQIIYSADDEIVDHWTDDHSIVRAACYKKVLRPADHSSLPIWSCDHNHPTWNEAAFCGQTPITQ